MQPACHGASHKYVVRMNIVVLLRHTSPMIWSRSACALSGIKAADHPQPPLSFGSGGIRITPREANPEFIKNMYFDGVFDCQMMFQSNAF